LTVKNHSNLDQRSFSEEDTTTKADQLANPFAEPNLFVRPKPAAVSLLVPDTSQELRISTSPRTREL